MAAGILNRTFQSALLLFRLFASVALKRLVIKSFSLLGCYEANVGISVPRIRYSLLVSSSRVKRPNVDKKTTNISYSAALLSHVHVYLTKRELGNRICLVNVTGYNHHH